MTKLLLDQGLPRSLAHLLRVAGFDAVHVSEVHAEQADDLEILELARREERHVITHDADFHRLQALSAAVNPSVIRLRMEGLKAAELMGVLDPILRRFAATLDRGAVVSVHHDTVRIRNLPIGRQVQ